MGSDDGSKKSVLSWLSFQRFLLRRRHRSKAVVALLTFLLCLLILSHLAPSPERLFTPTFTPDQAQLPPQCVSKAQTFYQRQQAAAQQQQQQRQGNPSPTLVLACHRRWCSTDTYWFGHCQPCGGIGDRTRFLLSQVEDAVRHAPHRTILVDAPMANVALAATALYNDPAGWLAELWRFRSYQVQDRRAVPLKVLQDTTSASARTLFTHFTPHGYALHDFDPCTFHMLFQPTPALRADIDRHNQAMNNQRSGMMIRRRNHSQQQHDDAEKVHPVVVPSIGIHFRTGDAAAFGIANNDTRIAATTAMSLRQAWHKMLDCAATLQEKVFPTADRVTYFVATDNVLVKQWIRQEQQQSLSWTDKNNNKNNNQRRYTLYTTDLEPESYLRGNGGDRNAWMEIYLLSARDALVVNARPKEYHGHAGRTSYFAQLAQHIGFIPKSHVQECVLDSG